MTRLWRRGSGAIFSNSAEANKYSGQYRNGRLRHCYPCRVTHPCPSNPTLRGREPCPRPNSYGAYFRPLPGETPEENPGA
ncbi:MAG: hypothetical protein GY796_30025 [Chloroflexi bacterium]|nr:hypothetical protein [Chloroflexota bacterium]